MSESRLTHSAIVTVHAYALWISHVTHRQNESRLTYTWNIAFCIVSAIMTVNAYTHTHTPCVSHVTRTKWVTSQIYMKHSILHSVSNRDCQLIHTMSESCHRYKWVTSHAWTSHVPSNQHIIRHRFSIRGCLCVHSMNVSHVSYTNKSRLTYGRVTSPRFNASFRIVSAFAFVYRTILSCHEWVLQCLVYHEWVWQCWV